MIVTELYTYHNPIVGTRNKGGGKVSEQQLVERINDLEQEIMKIHKKKKQADSITEQILKNTKSF